MSEQAKGGNSAVALPPNPITVQQALRWAGDVLAGVATSPQQEARWLLMAVLDCSATDLIVTAGRRLTPEQARQLATKLQACRDGQPLAYVLGQWSFCDLSLKVTPDTLVPRPETEGWVMSVLDRVKAMRATPLRVLELGTGSGAIALAVAQALPGAHVLATDRALSALKVAQENGRAVGVTNVRWACIDWCAALSETACFDVILSNPPYLRSDDPHLSSTIRHEPLSALVSGETGLEDITQIAHSAKKRLAPAGWLFMEHGFDQGPAARAVLSAAGFQSVETLRDLSGLDRVVVGRQEGDVTQEDSDDG